MQFHIPWYFAVDMEMLSSQTSGITSFLRVKSSDAIQYPLGSNCSAKTLSRARWCAQLSQAGC